jgi:hypothetical protein
MRQRTELDLAITELINSFGYPYTAGVLRSLLIRALQEGKVSDEITDGILVTLTELAGPHALELSR